MAEKHEFIKGIEDLHDHRFRDLMTQVKDLVKSVVELVEPSARIEVSRDMSIKDIEELFVKMRAIQYKAKCYSGELFVLRNHLKGVDERSSYDGSRKKSSNAKSWISSPNGVASKTGFSPDSTKNRT